jgi:peptidoglycan hydrolase-like protein with peptidoglycan-binding domain
MDASTRQALRDYQHTRRLGGNGELTRKTLVAIVDERCKHGCDLRLLIPPPQQGTGASRQTYDLTGDAFESLMVMGMQQILTKLGYDTNGLDGRAGPRTQNALRRFQRAEGLDESGQATGQTAHAILLRGCPGGCAMRFIVAGRPAVKQSSHLKQPSDLDKPTPLKHPSDLDKPSDLKR